MAFSFNWSPLTADASFYSRAQELLTTALNKSPKPPIIVDDILVTELNLGHVPPELEVLEIGDLAEDRFRGIFKTSYHGDAFLTLKTRVQANPLNTYLLTRPSFASPQPLAAASGLTIPLQITLSDIRLSGFVILVFSRQKGLTLVFRNDPLESLKVSSTLDSIPFVRDYLQKEIEGQLRVLLMDELPAIIHRLSQTWLVPEYRAKEDGEPGSFESRAPRDPVVDPFASPPQDPIDAHGNKLNPAEVASLSTEAGMETQSLFAQKNLLHLATLADCQRTLSLFTPAIRDVAVRASAVPAGPAERSDRGGLRSPAIRPAFSRGHSHASSINTVYSADRGLSHPRPSLRSFASQGYGASSGATGRQGKIHGIRQRKKRVVDLRRPADTDSKDPSLSSRLSGHQASSDRDSVTESTDESTSVLSSQPASAPGLEAFDCDPVTPPQSPLATLRASGQPDRANRTAVSSPMFNPPAASTSAASDLPIKSAIKASDRLRGDSSDLRPGAKAVSAAGAKVGAALSSKTGVDVAIHGGASSVPQDVAFDPKKQPSTGPSPSEADVPLSDFLRLLTDPANGGTIVEQAWMKKMASEIVRRYHDGQAKGAVPGAASDGETDAPPAYVG